MTDIFLSYTEKDRESARRVAARLEAHGWSVWWDRRIPAGETWRRVLEQALEGMRCMVVLWSSRSVDSEWVCEEASEGRRRGKLFPVLLEAVRPPAGFREIQAADLSGWDGSDEFEGMRLLLGDLERFLGTPGKPEAKSTDADTQPPATIVVLPGWRRSVQAWALAGVLALVGSAAYLLLQTPAPAVSARSAGSAAPPSPPAATTADPPAREAPAPGDHARHARAEPSVAPPAERPALRTERTRSSRCADWLARIQLGETLSEAAQSAYRKECR